MRDGIHFWTFRDATGVGDWDPDEEPLRFISGYGHSFLELHARLRMAGANTSIGRTPPRSTRVVVASLEELTRWAPEVQSLPRLGLALAALRCPSVVVIRGDLPLAVQLPKYVSLAVMPTAAAVELPARQVHLPHLPQRGLVPRRPTRAGRVSAIALKAYSFNVPEWLTDEAFLEQVGRLGMQLRIDTELDDPNRWPDFADVDIALCIQPRSGDASDGDHRRKPATKLVNAWCAGAIPIVSPDRPYLELAQPGVDALVASTPEDVVLILERLAGDPDLVLEIRAGAAQAARDYEMGPLLTQWHEALLAAPRSPRRLAAQTIVATAPGVLVQRAFDRFAQKRHRRNHKGPN